MRTDNGLDGIGSAPTMPDRYRLILHELAGESTDRTMEALKAALDSEIAAMADYLNACDGRSLAAARRDAARMVGERTESERLRSLAEAEAKAAEEEEREARLLAEELAEAARPHIEHWQRLEAIRGSLEKVQRDRG